MFCPNCGNQIPDGVRFCPYCGAGFEPPAAASGAAAARGAKDFAMDALSGVADRLDEMAGGTGHADLRFRNFFDAVPDHHTRGEADELFACGAPSTTPPLREVASDWPHPWLWSRVLLVLLVTTLGLQALVTYFQSVTCIPGLMFVGSAGASVAIMVFFFETNAFRNVSFARVLKYFLIGGVLSIAVTLAIEAVLPGSGSGGLVESMLTGLFEEAGKFLVVAYILSRSGRRNYVLTGLLVGAAVGAGFSVFENAGYVFLAYYYHGVGGIAPALLVRALSSVGGHPIWAAIEGGALALVEGEGGFDWSDLVAPRFVKFAAICIVLHGIWDMDLPLPYVKMLVLVAAAWLVGSVLLNRGLGQANELSRT